MVVQILTAALLLFSFSFISFLSFDLSPSPCCPSLLSLPWSPFCRRLERNPSMSGTLPGSWSTLTALTTLYVLPWPLVAFPSPRASAVLPYLLLHLLLLLVASLFLYSL